MVTKLKSIRYHITLKSLAFLIIALSLTMAFVQLISINLMDIPFETIIETNSSVYNNETYTGKSYNQTEWTEMRVEAIQRVQIFGISIILALVLLIYLTLVVGKDDKDGDIKLTWHDRIPSDILTVAYACLFPIWLSSMGSVFRRRMYSVNQFNWVLVAVGTLTFLFISVLGLYYVSSVKQIKAKTFIKRSLWFRVTYFIYDLFKSLFDGRAFSKNGLTKSLFKRQLVFIIASAFMVFMTFILLMVPQLMIVPIILEFMMIYWFIKGNRKTYEAIDKGFNDSLEEQMKAERMKIQLITNVSHDLKTPLTSIIGYVDLLSKEPLEEPAREFVSVLSEKSDRLKHIVSDLFDLAKSTTGNIQVDLEELDLKRLIEQTMGDLSDEIEKSGLEFKMQLPEEAVMIQSDGKKLYRVFMNLLDNALKYTLRGTRVYITMKVSEGLAMVSIKNIAGYEMTFTEEEVLQRFTRGDQSRTSEGSGLGISIAESFTHVCGGDFKLVIDGDLFKVNVSFPVTKSQAPHSV